MTKIFIIDDHLLFAEGLAAMLKLAGFEQVSVFTNPTNAEAMLELLQPNIVFLDVNLDSENGLILCKKWLKTYPLLKIIALSMYHEYRYVWGMKEAGAKAYLQKNSSLQQIIEAIREVEDGRTYFRGTIADILKTPTFSSQIELNPKEKKVLKGVIEGKTSRQIAEELSVSIKTVEFYRNGLLIKFDAKNAIELVNKTRELF